MITVGLISLLYASYGMGLKPISTTLPSDDLKVAPDNSGTNARDRRAGELTAEDQSSQESDLLLTRQIRKQITDQHELSTNAQNVKIVTQNGIVTLKGPVRSRSEINLLVEIAHRIAGHQSVKNKLEVASGE